ncbi:MAG TPA: DUF6152 family protein [Candidatus Acidoferrum sp.]|nr:DUF6152 family protein [Candidatus Acidoferrum sp.]
MKLHTLIASTALLLGLATTAQAHHSAVQYDFTKQGKYTGKVTEFSAKNPHLLITLEITDAKGPHKVEVEGHSLNNMYRDGYRKGMVNIGDTITVNVAPLKTGVEGGYVISVITAKNEFFGMQSSAQARATAEGKDTKN